MIKFNLNDRVGIVTGGAQGFGFAITERFISSGAKVIIWDIDENECKKAISKINSKNCSFQIVDVRQIKEVETKLNEVEKKFGKIDIFINNAGIAGINTSVIDMHTIKPIDSGVIEKFSKATRLIVTLEEHNVIGGLGSAVSEYLCTLGKKPPLLSIGIQDEYGPSGEYKYLLEKKNLLPDQIAKRISKKFLNI